MPWRTVYCLHIHNWRLWYALDVRMYPCPQSRTVILTGSGDACWRRRWEVIFINIILTPKSPVLSGFVCGQDYFDCYTYIVVPMIWSETRRLNSHHVCSASFRQTLIQAQFLLQFRRQAIFIFCMEIGECYNSSLKVINKRYYYYQTNWLDSYIILQCFAI